MCMLGRAHAVYIGGGGRQNFQIHSKIGGQAPKKVRKLDFRGKRLSGERKEDNEKEIDAA